MAHQSIFQPMKLTSLIICCFISLIASAQRDLLLLKQKEHTLQTWTHGSYILFQFSSKQWIEGIIKSIKNDSITIDQIQVRQLGNQFGLPSIDTAHFGLMKFHINEIYAMPKRASYSVISNGMLFQYGSVAYILLNVANSLIKGDPVFSSANLSGLGIASAFFILGKILQNSHQTYLQMGKKYRMVTIQM